MTQLIPKTFNLLLHLVYPIIILSQLIPTNPYVSLFWGPRTPLIGHTPGKLVTHNYRQLSANFVLLSAKVAHYYGQLRLLGIPQRLKV